MAPTASAVAAGEPYLLRTSGALMIDVFKRGNFTSDANSLAVDVFNEVGAMYAYLGDAAAAATYTEAAAKLAASINGRLWDAASADHFVTQLNPDNTTADFVDYDSNLLAAAFVPMSGARRRAVLRRVDAGACTHAAPGTYISEKLYGPDDVYVCDKDKPEIRCVGDSRVSYGRVAWLDALARRAVRDAPSLATLSDAIIGPIKSEVPPRPRMGCAHLRTLPAVGASPSPAALANPRASPRPTGLRARMDTRTVHVRRHARPLAFLLRVPGGMGTARVTLRPTSASSLPPPSTV